jgi:hypothetical protein
MKRRGKDLFTDVEAHRYLIDTSAWLDIDARADVTIVWHLIYALISCSRTFATRSVLNELRENAIFKRHLKQHERALLTGDRDDPEYLLHVGRVTLAHPAMSKARGEKTPADPFVVALAELEGYVVVCDESRVTRRNRKIPSACKQRGIKCMTLDELVATERPILVDG